nr:Ger(x)C family spore germination protein [Neobacillus sp. Marseille-Q6967]
MKPIYKLFWFLFLFLFLCGCVRKEVLDDISLIEGIGFDYTDRKTIVGTVLVPVYLPDQVPKNIIYTGESIIKKTILQEIQRKVADPIVTGSLEVVLFSRDLAEKEGILDLVDAFQRDPGVGTGLQLAVVDGEAKEFLKGEYGIRGNAIYISNLFEHNYKKENLPNSNLQLFLSDFYQEGKTPYIPEVKKTGKNQIEISGISLFKYGKMVEFIKPEKMFYFKLMVDKFSEGMHRVKVDKGDAAVRSIHSRHHFKLTKRNPLEVTIYIKTNGVINEFTGQALTPQTIQTVRKQFKKNIEQECHKLVQQFKEKNIDPIGIGHFVKSQTRNFDLKNWWENQYKDITVKVEAEVEITEAGVIE